MTDADRTGAALGSLKRKRLLNEFPDMAHAHNDLGELFLQRGNLEKAGYHFLQAVKLNGELPWTYINLGKIFERRGLTKEADKALRMAERVHAGISQILLEIGEIYCKRGSLKKAEHYFRRAVRPGASSAKAYLEIFWMLRAQELYVEAARWLKEGAELYPDVPALHFQLGYVCGKLRKYAEMRKCFRRYLKTAKSEKESGADRIIARVCLEDFGGVPGEAEGALDGLSLEDLGRISEPWPDVRTLQATRSFYSVRVKALKRLVCREPDSPWLNFYLYSCSLHAEERGTAELCRERLEKLPGKRYGWMRFGIAKRQLTEGLYREAVAGFSAVLRSRPDHVIARCLLAETYLCSGRRREAFEEFSRAEAIAGNTSHVVRGWRGEALLWLGRYAEALVYLDRAVNNGNWMALCWRGAAKLLSGRPEEALSDLDQVMRLGYQDAEGMIWRAETRRRLGKREDALKDLEKALSIRTEDPAWVYVNLALIKAELGDLAGMWEAYKNIPREMLVYIKGRRGWGAEMPRTREDVRNILEYGLGLARGNRRPEHYTWATWKRPGNKKREAVSDGCRRLSAR